MGWKKVLRTSWRLDPVSGQRRKQRSASNIPLGIDLQRWGRLVALFSAHHDYMYVLRCGRVVGKMERAKQLGGNESLRGEAACGLSWKACDTQTRVQ